MLNLIKLVYSESSANIYVSNIKNFVTRKMEKKKKGEKHSELFGYILGQLS